MFFDDVRITLYFETLGITYGHYVVKWSFFSYNIFLTHQLFDNVNIFDNVKIMFIVVCLL